jgi:hypothetical protein
MKRYLTICFVNLFFLSCDKRDCECLSDSEFSWKNEKILENTGVLLPNGVIDVGQPLTLSIYTVNLNEALEWNLLTANLYKDEHVFVDNTYLDQYILNNTFIQFPHELFTLTNGDFVRGPVCINLSIAFPESGSVLLITGTIYFYTCEDLDDGFNRVECRWPSQVIGDIFNQYPC